MENIPERRPDIPEEIWELIIANVPEDRFLEPLSRVSSSFLSITNRLKKTLIISDPASFFLPKLFQRFPNLKHVAFDGFTQNPNYVLLQMSEFGYNLESLDLSDQERIPIEGIQCFPGATLNSIRSLKLRSIPVLDDDHLGIIAELLSNLEEIDLSYPKDDYVRYGPSGITDEGIELLASKLSNLRKINLSGNYLISDKCLFSLAERCGNLEELVVKDCNFITRDGIVAALHGCQNLRLVGLLGVDISAADVIQPLASARNLCVLDFAYMSVSDGLLFAITKSCLPLKKFTLFHCKSFTFSSILSLLRSYQSLEYLALEGVYFLSDRGMLDLAKFLPNVNTVKLNHCGRLSDSSFLTLLKNCRSLNSLEMEQTLVGKQEFAVNNVNNTQIRVLKLASNKNLNNESLENIAESCPNLEILDLTNCSTISGKGIGEILKKCLGLRQIEINRCPHIKHLSITEDLPKLEVLGARSSGINDDGLMAIGNRCHELLHLDVSSCTGVTSKGVKEVVGKCSKLREINLSYCRSIARDIIAYMVFSRPSLKKIHPPQGIIITDSEKSLFLQHGCQVC